MIDLISAEYKYKLRQKSIRYMVDSPSAKGLTPQTIKERMTGYVLDNEESIIAILENIINQANSDINSANDDIQGLKDGSFELTVDIVDGTITNVSISNATITNSNVNNSNISSSTITDSELDEVEIVNSSFKNGIVESSTIKDVQISGNSAIKQNETLQNAGTILGGNLNNNTINNPTINNGSIGQMSNENSSLVTKKYTDDIVQLNKNNLETSLKQWVTNRDNDHIVDASLGYNNTTGIITIVFTRENGDTITKTLDLPAEFAVVGVETDVENNSLIFTMSSGATFTISIDAMFHALTEEINDLIDAFNAKIDEIDELESNIASSERTRQANETIRQANETTRQSNETVRASNESSRQTNETTRNNAEINRNNAEINRSNEFQNMVNTTVTVHALPISSDPTVEKTGGEGEPYNLDFGIPKGNIYYATFGINLNSGHLIMTYAEDYEGLTFLINDKGHLEVVING